MLEVSDAAPAPGEPTEGANNVLTFTVPAENTVVQLGASQAGPASDAIGGIRMTTAAHAHMTTEAPLTTVSLGEVGGHLGAFEKGTSPGICVYTAEDLNFEVGGELKGHIKGDEDTHNTGNVESKIDGNVKLEVIGTRKEEIGGDHEFIWRGHESKITFGSTFETFVGAKNEVNIGEQFESNTGARAELFIGGHKAIIYAYKSETIFGKVRENITGSKKAKIKGNVTEDVTGNVHVNVSGDEARIIGGKNEIQCMEHAIKATEAKLEATTHALKVTTEKLEATEWKAECKKLGLKGDLADVGGKLLTLGGDSQLIKIGG
jgi:hypothetical protein